MTDGWFRSLPYFLGDMRLQGFLGRNLAHQFSAILQMDQDVQRWNEDDVLHALSLLGWDHPGDYILGEQALRRVLQEQQNGSHFLSDDEISTIYPQRALQAQDARISDEFRAICGINADTVERLLIAQRD